MKSFVSDLRRVVLLMMLVVAPLAIKAQEQVALVTINHSDKNFNQAVTYLLSGEWEEAITHFRKAQEHYIAKKNYRQVAACYFGLTNCYFFKGEYTLALQLCEEALALHKREVKDDPEGLDSLVVTHSLCKAAVARLLPDSKSSFSMEDLDTGNCCLEK